MPLFTINRTVAPPGDSSCHETMETAKFAMSCMVIIAICAVVVGALFKIEGAIVIGVLSAALTGIAGLSNFQQKAIPGMTTTASTTTSSTPTVPETTEKKEVV